jgi:hypothetical protein
MTWEEPDSLFKWDSTKAAGFVVTKRISDPVTELEGFVGYLDSIESIFVSFRGTTTERNLEVDVMYDKVPYNKWPECDCNVHMGFQMATEGCYPEVLPEV